MIVENQHKDWKKKKAYNRRSELFRIFYDKYSLESLVKCRKMYNFAADLNKYTSDES